MKFLLVLLPVLFQFQNVNAQTSHNSIDQFFSEAKKQEIKSGDLDPAEANLKKVIKKDINVTVDWNSFKGTNYAASQELGANVQTMVEVLTGMAEKPDDLKTMQSKLKTMNFKNTKNPVPTMSFRSGTLTLEGDYSDMKWSKAGKVSDLVRKALK